MSFHDRGYNQSQFDGKAPNPIVRFFQNLPWATRWILILNVGIWVIDMMAQGWFKQAKPFETFGIFSFNQAVKKFELWRFVTATFLHANAFHLFGNMMGLFFFGPVIERLWGTKKFLVFYLVCGVGSIIAYSVAIPLMSGLNPDQYVLGASGSIYAILIAFAVFGPDATIYVMMIFPMKAKIFAWVIVGIAAFSSIRGALSDAPVSNLGGHVAHLGGAVLGYLFAKQPHLLNKLTDLVPGTAGAPSSGGYSYGSGMGGGGMGGMGGGMGGGGGKEGPYDTSGYDPKYTEGPTKTVISKSEKKAEAKAKAEAEKAEKNQEKINAILDKVRDKGIQSLSSKEKKLLQEETDRLNKG